MKSRKHKTTMVRVSLWWLLVLQVVVQQWSGTLSFAPSRMLSRTVSSILETKYSSSSKHGPIIDPCSRHYSDDNINNNKIDDNDSNDCVHLRNGKRADPRRNRNHNRNPAASRNPYFPSSLSRERSSPPKIPSRRKVMATTVGSLAVLATTASTEASAVVPIWDRNRYVSPPLATENALPSLVEVPLEYVATLGAYVVRYNLFGEEFAAVVDTGSPFLTVPFYCRPYRNQKMRWGCYRPERTQDSGYANTVEGFDNNYGPVVWRKADFSFPNRVVNKNNDNNNNNNNDPSADADDILPLASTWAIQTTAGVGKELLVGDNDQPREPSPPNSIPVVFGVLGEDLLNGSGGVFFGLIRETDRWIRPSFLGQTGYTSFCVDLRHSPSEQTADARSGPKLVLSKTPMIGGFTDSDEDKGNVIPLVRDLKKRYGAPVVHYTAKASRLVVNGLPLRIDSQKRPLYVIFDTGVSGMVVSQELFDGRYLQARKNREKSLWGTVSVTLETLSGREVVLSAKKPIATPLGKAIPWKGFKGNLLVLGLAFLDGRAMTVDTERGALRFVG